MKHLPYSRQTIGDDDIRAVVKTLRAPFITQGPKIAEFERAVARYTGAKYVVAFSSGTAALHAAYAAAGIGKDDEVIIPALTFAATSNAAIYLGARPVFADVDQGTGNIELADTKKKITKRTKAIVAVDYAGAPADLSSLRALAKKRGLVLLEDGAQSLGARVGTRPLGTMADMTMFSFHPVKSITTGEGGVIVTNSKKYDEFLRMFRTHGMTKNTRLLKDRKKAAWHQEMHVLGNNYRITDIQAALGMSQMRKLEIFIEKRRAAAARYFSLFRGVEGILLPPSDVLGSSAWHLFVIRVDPRIRDKVFTALRKRGIGVQVHYLPVYEHPYYRALGYRGKLCPKAERFSYSAISLPLFPGIRATDQEFVARTLRSILKKLS